jgi:hypothetical protein
VRRRDHVFRDGAGLGLGLGFRLGRRGWRRNGLGLDGFQQQGADGGGGFGADGGGIGRFLPPPLRLGAGQQLEGGLGDAGEGDGDPGLGD